MMKSITPLGRRGPTRDEAETRNVSDTPPVASARRLNPHHCRSWLAIEVAGLRPLVEWTAGRGGSGADDVEIRALAAQSVARPSADWKKIANAMPHARNNSFLAEVVWQPTTKVARLYQCDTLRCVFGSPFRPASMLAMWRTDTVVALARQMSESRDFSATPILADALQDAGCNSDDVLDHCRRPGPHIRGC
jgi:hypothetical protein